MKDIQLSRGGAWLYDTISSLEAEKVILQKKIAIIDSKIKLKQDKANKGGKSSKKPSKKNRKTRRK